MCPAPLRDGIVEKRREGDSNSRVVLASGGGYARRRRGMVLLLANNHGNCILCSWRGRGVTDARTGGPPNRQRSPRTVLARPEAEADSTLGDAERRIAQPNRGSVPEAGRTPASLSGAHWPGPASGQPAGCTAAMQLRATRG